MNDGDTKVHRKRRETNVQSTTDDARRTTEISLGALGNYLGFRMRRVHDIQAREFRRLTQDQNLSQGMFTALALIAANPGISQVTLAQEMGLDTSAMVPLIDELEHRGWVLRQRSRDDRRRYRLVLTAGGRKALDGLTALLDDVESSGLAVLTADELKVVSAVLDKMYRTYRRNQLTPLEDHRRETPGSVRPTNASTRRRRVARRPSRS